MPRLVQTEEYQKPGFEWTIGIVENTTDILIQKRRIVLHDNNIDSNMGSLSFEIDGQILFPYAANELQYIQSNTQREKYIGLLEYNMQSPILRPQLENIVGGLVDVPDPRRSPTIYESDTDSEVDDNNFN